jgi:heptosyltransferase-2
LGDLLLGIPFFKALRRLYPQAKLTLLCRKDLGAFFVSTGLFDEAVEVDKTSRASWRQTKTRLRARRFDLIFSPHESTRTTLLVATLSATKKIGYRNFLNRVVFNDTVVRPMELPEALRQMTLVSMLDPELARGIHDFSTAQGRGRGGVSENSRLIDVPEWANMRLPKKVEMSEKVRTILASPRFSAGTQEKDRIAVLAPGSVWPTKMWTSNGYMAVANYLVKEGFRVLLLGGAAERGICNEIARQVPGAISLAGETSIAQSIEIMERAQVVVCNDSGSMHMASAVGSPSVSIWGPTVLEFGYRPWQNRSRVVEISRKQMECRPCGKHGARKCPLGTHDCMKMIDGARVVSAIQEVLKG